jgi:hypothetical protein
MTVYSQVTDTSGFAVPTETGADINAAVSQDTNNLI